MCKGCYKKCFSAGTQFQITLDGDPRMATAEEIFNWVSVERKVEVLTADPAKTTHWYKRVRSVWSSGTPEPTVTIRHASFGAIQFLRLTPDHLVCTKNRGVVQAKDVTSEDALLSPVPIPKSRGRVQQVAVWPVGRVEQSGPAYVYGIELFLDSDEKDTFIVANGILAAPMPVTKEASRP